MSDLDSSIVGTTLAPVCNSADPCFRTPLVLSVAATDSPGRVRVSSTLSDEEVIAIAGALFELAPCESDEAGSAWQLVGRSRAVGV